MSGEVKKIAQYGEYEVWEHDRPEGPYRIIADAEGNIIEPGNGDLLAALLACEIPKKEGTK